MEDTKKIEQHGRTEKDENVDHISITRDLKRFYSNVFIFHNFSGDDMYTINGKRLLKNNEELFGRISDFFCQKDILNDQSKILLSRGENNSSVQLWDLNQKKEIASYDFHENSYFMGSGTIVGSYYDNIPRVYDSPIELDSTPRLIDIETQKLTRTINNVVRFFPIDDTKMMCVIGDRKKDSFNDWRIGLYDVRAKEPTKLLEESYLSNFPDCRQIIGDYFPLYDKKNKEILFYSYSAGKVMRSEILLYSSAYTLEDYYGNDMAMYNDICIATCKDEESDKYVNFQCIDIKTNKTAVLDFYDYGDLFERSNVVFNGKECNHLLYLGRHNPYYERSYTFHSFHKK
jgi:WD40 repeat protein